MKSKWTEEWNVQGWLVICDIRSWGTPHPYVVWWMDTNGNVTGGQYCLTLDEAQMYFEQRGG